MAHKLKETKRKKKEVSEKSSQIKEYDISNLIEYDRDGIEKTEVEESRSIGRVLRIEEGGEVLAPTEDLRFPEYESVYVNEKGDVIGIYDKLKDFLEERELQGVSGKKASVHVHHLVHQATLSELGIPTGTCPSVVLEENDHNKSVHDAAIKPILSSMRNVGDLKKHYRDIYSSLEVPEWANLSDQYLDQYSESINQKLSSSEYTNMSADEQKTETDE